MDNVLDKKVLLRGAIRQERVFEDRSDPLAFVDK